VDKTKVKTWISQEINGLIFVWYHCEDELPWTVPRVKEIDNNSWILHGKNEFYVNSHIQDIPENGADVAHLKSVHSSSLLTGTDIRFTHSSLLCIGNHIWDAK
jgi:cholesterol 7-desaturase